MAVTPSIRKLCREAWHQGRSVGEMLEMIRAHGRQYGCALTFDDAIELVHVFGQEGAPTRLGGHTAGFTRDER